VYDAHVAGVVPGPAGGAAAEIRVGHPPAALRCNERALAGVLRDFGLIFIQSPRDTLSSSLAGSDGTEQTGSTWKTAKRHWESQEWHGIGAYQYQ
jgi:hypothetical protein